MNFGEGPYVEIGESEDVFGDDMSNDDEEECQNRPLRPNLSFQSLANLIWYDSGSHTRQVVYLVVGQFSIKPLVRLQ